MWRFLRFWPLAIPWLGCLAVYAVMRDDAIIARANLPLEVNRFVYDESDLTAFSLRGLNTSLGRLPGRKQEPYEPDWTIPPSTLPRRLEQPQPELDPRYYLEYPTPALLLFRAGYLLQPSYELDDVPSVVADSHQFSIAFYEPQTPSQRAVWSGLRFAIQVYIAAGALALCGLILVCGMGLHSNRPWGGPVWLAALPAAVFFALNRYDVWPALATAVAFVCLGRDRRFWCGAALGIGVLLKVYPVLFAPVIWRYLGIRGSIPFVAGFVLTVAGGLGLSFATLGLAETIAPIQVQLSRPYESGLWTFYGRLLPEALAEAGSVRLGILTLTILLCMAGTSSTVDSVLRRCMLILIVFVVLAVFWSPQWVLWFLPLFILLGQSRRWPIAAAVILDLLSYFLFPVFFWNTFDLPNDEYRSWAIRFTYLRGVLWLLLAGLVIWDERRSRRPIDLVGVLRQFRAQLPQRIEEFRNQAANRNTPRGLRWLTTEANAEPILVQGSAGELVALVSVVVQFEPIPGSELADVPQAREPRTITAVFRHEDDQWRTDGRAIFNLTPEQFLERGSSGYRRIG